MIHLHSYTIYTQTYTHTYTEIHILTRTQSQLQTHCQKPTQTPKIGDTKKKRKNTYALWQYVFSARFESLRCKMKFRMCMRCSDLHAPRLQGCVCVCVCVCVYVSICIYIFVYINTKICVCVYN